MVDIPRAILGECPPATDDIGWFNGRLSDMLVTPLGDATAEDGKMSDRLDAAVDMRPLQQQTHLHNNIK